MTWSGAIEQHVDMGFKFLLGGMDGEILYKGVKNLIHEFNDFTK